MGVRRRRATVAMLGVTLAMGLLGIVTAARADEPPGDSPAESASVTITRASTPPVIDGRLDDPVWTTAAVIDGLRQVIPVEDAEASQRTVVRLLYDADALYIGVQCFDESPREIIATQMRRDGELSSDDRVVFVIDPIFDSRNGFLFAFNPRSVRVDGLVVENRNVRAEWDGIWSCRARIDDDGWTAEVLIPYKTISFNPETTTWRFNIERVVRRTNELSRWASPMINKPLHSISDAGVIEGMEELSRGVGLDIKPYGKITGRHGDTGDQTDLDVGFDLFYKLTPALNLALTLNTDFAETEVDAREVNLTRFPLFFPEKRDFFLQEAGIFEFGGIRRNPLPFQSRRIGLDSTGEPTDILFGAKLTGRVDRWNIGLLHTLVDEAPGVEKKHLTVGRFTYNVLDESSVGVITTVGDPLSNEENVVAGADLSFRTSTLFGSQVLEANAFALFSSQSGNEGGDDYAYGLKLDYPNDRFDLSFDYTEIGEEFDAALGFVPRRGIREYIARGTHRWRMSEGWIRTIDVGGRLFVITDLENQIETQNFDLDVLEIRSADGDRAEVSVEFNRERLTEPFEIQEGIFVAAGDYHTPRYGVEFSTADSRLFSAAAGFEIGEFFDGRRLETNLALELRPNAHFFGRFEWERNDVDLSDGSFVVNVMRARADVLFTADLSWTNFIQWDDVSDSLGLNSRIRWIIEPGNELFFVVNQAFDTESSFTPSSTEVTGKIVWTFRY